MIPASLLLVLLNAEPSTELFRIERSKNANVVVYEAKAGKETPLDARDPVSASWILLAKNGERQALGFFEKAFAYGFEVKLASGAQSAVLTLKALEGRSLKVVKRGERLAAVGMIAGAEAVLERVFVTTDERTALPKVTSIELFGVDAASGARLTEKIVAGK